MNDSSLLYNFIFLFPGSLIVHPPGTGSAWSQGRRQINTAAIGGH